MVSERNANQSTITGEARWAVPTRQSARQRSPKMPTRPPHFCLLTFDLLGQERLHQLLPVVLRFGEQPLQLPFIARIDRPPIVLQHIH